MAWISAGNSVKDLVLRIAGEKHHSLALIALYWRSIVGELLAERSMPLKYEHNTLFVKVYNSTWLQEMLLMKHQFINDISTKLSLPISEIVFLAAENTRRKYKRKSRLTKMELSQ